MPRARSTRNISVGADLGRTWLRAAAAGSGRVLCRARVPAPPPGELRGVLRRILDRWGAARKVVLRSSGTWRVIAPGATRKVALRPRFLTVGARGIGRPGPRRALERLLAGLADKVEVMTDLELARDAAFGGDPGIVVIAGSGSGAWGKDACGHSARAGGLGPLLGDECSGFWIAREWLKSNPRSEKTLLNLAHRPDAIRAVARRARRALRRLGRDRAVNALVDRGQRDLIGQASRVARALHFGQKVPISWHGGVFDNPSFKKRFLRNLKAAQPANRRTRWIPRPPKMRPEVAAALRLSIARRSMLRGHYL